jgi:hypothetical protein
VRYLHPGRAEFHVLDKPISFDERQAELHRLPLPLILVGCAGSGKTALTLMKLRDIAGDVLYVTQSEFLAESAASLYFAHGYENTRQNVDFLSCRKLLESIEVPKGRAVTLRDFRPFFERHRANCRFTSAHQLVEELRGVVTAAPDGPLTEEAYLSLGVRQSIYGPEERRAVYPFFAKYRRWLAEASLYDPNLLAHAYRVKAERRYDAVVVDEIQDLTNAELSLVLAVLKEPKHFLHCGDEFFVLAAMMALFHDCYGKLGSRAGGFSALTLDEHVLAAFPRSVVPEERRRRVYWNGVLARAEVGSTYRPARKLWRRERQGHYVPSDAALLRTADEHGKETTRSLFDALRVGLLDDHAVAATAQQQRSRIGRRAIVR